MRCIVFYVSAGNGHKSAAESIKSNFKSINKNAQIECIDILKYTNKIVDKFVSVGYEQSIKISPYIFGRMYYHTEKKNQDIIFSNMSYAINRTMTYKLIPLVNQFDPDIIISTHPFSTEIISILKRKYGYRIPLITVLTDFMPHSFWIHPQNNAFVVSNQVMKDELIRLGVKKDIIYNYGIPIRENFLKKYNRKQVLKELELDPAIFTLLVMAGSTTSSKIEKLVEVIAELSLPFQAILVSGGNLKLHSSFLEIQKSSKVNMCVLGYTNKIPELMQASDAIVTKPGGLTVTECLVSDIPIIIFSPIPGVEMRNKEFLLENKLALYIENVKDANSLLFDIIHNKEILINIKNEYKKYESSNSAKNLYNLSVNIINEYRKIKYSRLEPVLMN